LAIAAESPKIELRGGERIVLLGNTLIEREQQFGDWEMALTLHGADRNVPGPTIRNLGWSGDTVWAESRGIFDPPQEGYRRMLAQVAGLKPTLIVLGYGNNEALASNYDPQAFLAQYRKLIQDLRKAAGGDVRFVMLSPVRQCPIVASAEVTERNTRRLSACDAALRKLADEERIPYRPILHILTRHQVADGLNPATDDGVHPNATGYALSAAEVWGFGDAPTVEELNSRDRLRRAIVAKNSDYFWQWRPQNITYLTGFRKHEQGQNAKELAEFDRLIAKQEREIARLRIRDRND
jgi:lysophospholipase L1-like esterase